MHTKAEVAASQMEKIGNKGGLDADTVAEIRRGILGWQGEKTLQRLSSGRCCRASETKPHSYNQGNSAFFARS